MSKNLNAKVLSGLLSLCMLPSVSANYSSNDSLGLYNKTINTMYNSEVKTPEKKWPKIVKKVGEVVTGVSGLAAMAMWMMALYGDTDGDSNDGDSNVASDLLIGSVIGLTVGTAVRWVGLVSNKVVNGHFYDV